MNPKLIAACPTLAFAVLLGTDPAPVPPAPAPAPTAAPAPAPAPLPAPGPAPSPRQDAWTWPEETVNLQVLPADWPGTRLRAPMTGFTQALGVDCSYCHVGEPDAPRSTYDFASDDNPNKDRAREMLRMLRSVNEHLQEIEPSGRERVNMWCHTCHRGRPRPMTLAEELSQAHGEAGGAAAVARYDELRAKYFGRGAFDFGDEFTLNRLGYVVLEEDAETAVRVFLRNTELFPGSANVWDSLGEGYLRAGDEHAAAESYRKSLELDPDNENARSVLERIEDA